MSDLQNMHQRAQQRVAQCEKELDLAKTALSDIERMRGMACSHQAIPTAPDGTTRRCPDCGELVT